jgi:hypothetical protein
LRRPDIQISPLNREVCHDQNRYRTRFLDSVLKIERLSFEIPWSLISFRKALQKTFLVEDNVRYYCNCLSTFCPESCDPRKIHGDVAEFYDQRGKFMDIAVYMGDGKYCPLPYDVYKK